MPYLLLSIFISILFGISFKLLADFKINSFQAIIVNYVIAGTLGFATTSSGITPLNVFSQPWIWFGIGLGLVFICSLFFIAETTARSGISVAQVANRMSVVIPITIAILFYKDSLTVYKIIGIIIALAAVYLVSYKESSASPLQKMWWLFPLMIFVFSGIIDSSINYTQRNLLNDNNFDAFLSTIFTFAFIFGAFVLLYQLIVQKQKFQAKAIPAGAVIGLINYGSMFFIFKALNSNVLESSALFPVNNLSILTISTIVSVLVFKEKLSKMNWIGILLSILAIFILGLLPVLLKN